MENIKTEVSEVLFAGDRGIRRFRVRYSAGDQRSVVLVGASEEYLWDQLHTNDLKREAVDRWRNTIVKKWNDLGEKIFKRPVWYDTYAHEAIGHENIQKFLEERTPKT